MTTKRFYIKDLRKSQYTGIGRTKTSPWVVIDRTTNRIVDEATTQYDARQAAKLFNDGILKPEGGN